MEPRTATAKSRVRLMKVTRKTSRSEAYHDDSMSGRYEVLLTGDFDGRRIRRGDNSQILPTDTMKNTVYSFGRAKSNAATTMEDYARGV